MTEYDPQRHPHLAPGYDNRGDMAARPSAITPQPTTTSSGPSFTTPPTITNVESPQGEAPDDATMRSGKALEEMTVVELRKRAAARGVKWRGLSKAKLIRSLRQ